MLNRAEQDLRPDDAFDGRKEVGVEEEIEHRSQLGVHDVEPPRQLTTDSFNFGIDLLCDSGESSSERFVFAKVGDEFAFLEIAGMLID